MAASAPGDDWILVQLAIIGRPGWASISTRQHCGIMLRKSLYYPRCRATFDRMAQPRRSDA